MADLAFPAVAFLGKTTLPFATSMFTGAVTAQSFLGVTRHAFATSLFTGAPLLYSRLLPNVAPLKAHDARQQYMPPVNGQLSGTVTKAGVPVQRAVVRCYYRLTGLLVSQALTDASGAWTIKGLDTADTAGYYTVAMDPPGGATFNSIIYDRVTPV